jgi:FkbM family methyltransferase
MTNEERTKLVEVISEREILRPLSRLARLARKPIRTLPFYILATLGHIKPFLISFKTLWGTNMTCYLPEGNTFFYYGYCEANLTNFLLRYIKQDSVCIDVGAHVGFYSMLLSELVGPRGAVHSFEPTPWTFKLLEKNTTNLKNVTLNNKALSDTARTLSFADYGPGYGAYNTAHKDGAQLSSHTATTVKVASLPLDTYCRENNLVPDFIKIDSEGFEFEVLSGAEHLLDQVRPLISIEVAGGSAWAENSQQSFLLLMKKDYQPYEISTTGLLSVHKFLDSYKYDNLIFVPKEKVSLLNGLFLNHG